jgi:hypothetical protein
MRTKIFIGFLTCLALALFLYATTSAIAATPEEEVLQVATNFVKAMNDDDSKLLTSLWYQSPKTSYYNPGGKFLTMGWMTNAPGGGEMFTMNHPQVTMLGDNAAFITGYYTIMKSDEATKQLVIDYVKETLIVQKIQGKWLIVHEHSSFVPK